VNTFSAQNGVLESLQVQGVLDECRRLLLFIKHTLDACEQMHGKEAKNFGRRLIWPFKDREVKETIQRLSRLRGLLSAAVATNSA
jgi:hypothetical protein